MATMKLRNIIAACCIALCACDADNEYGSPYACSFVFFASYHPTSLLTLALGNPGTFATVVPKTEQGVTHLVLTTNYGKQEDLPMVTEKENSRLNYSSMGANRRLIIGCSKFNGMKAYDGQCSNCLINLGGLNYPLQWTDDGEFLRCDKCHRVYDPNAGGMPVENGQKGDRSLYQYAIQYNGETLHVYNGQPRNI